uniref:MRG domain-containing protein n=1 Tax=Strongyloides stercoralis TaxID=6248 RepID=A0A0K0E7G9_STRER
MERYIHSLSEGDESYCLHEGRYYKIKIVSITGTGNDKCFKIHYDGWNSRYDESILFNEALNRISPTYIQVKPIVTEVEEAKNIVKPIDELIDKESLSMELQLAYALYGDNKSNSEEDEHSSKESSEGVPKFYKYDSITSQSWSGVYFWNLPRYFLFYRDFTFHERFICNEDRAFLNEIKKMDFDTLVRYYDMNVVKESEEEILNHLECPHCSTDLCNGDEEYPSLKEQITSQSLYIPKTLRKIVKKVGKLKKSLGVIRLPARHPVFRILYDFYNEEIRQKILQNTPICPLYKYVAPSIEKLFKKLMIIRLLFDVYLPTRLLYRHERIQLTDRYHPNFLTTLLEQRCYIEYSRLYDYEHFIRFFISLRQSISDKKVEEVCKSSESICSNDEEENEDEIDEDEEEEDGTESSVTLVENIIEDPVETPGLFILCQKILKFLVEKKDLYSLNPEEYTFLDPYLVREIDDATVFSGKRPKEHEVFKN